MKIKNGVRLFIAMMKGDDVEAKAIRHNAKCESAIELALYSKKYQKLQLQEDLIVAEEEQKVALINGGALIKTKEDGEAYVKALLEAEKDVIEAKDALAELETQVTCLEKALKDLNKEVEEA